MDQNNDTLLNNTLGVERQPIRQYSFSKPYWEATREKRLVIQYCPRSGQYQHFPRPVSIVTGLADLEWREVSGEGEVVSVSLTRRGFQQFQGAEPYAVAIVRLDVGVDFVADLVNCDAADARIGLKVKPYWHPLTDGTHLLLFQPA